METQKIINLLNETNNESSRFATRNWYVVDDQNNTEYVERNDNDLRIKFEAKPIKTIFYDHSLAYILVTGDTTAESSNANTRVAFKNCAPFTKCLTHENDEHVDTSKKLDFIMHTYNLNEYSDNHSDTSGS